MALIVGGTTVTGTQTLDATRLTGNLPAISGASLTGISAGAIKQFVKTKVTNNGIYNDYTGWLSCGSDYSINITITAGNTIVVELSGMTQANRYEQAGTNHGHNGYKIMRASSYNTVPNEDAALGGSDTMVAYSEIGVQNQFGLTEAQMSYGVYHNLPLRAVDTPSSGTQFTYYLGISTLPTCLGEIYGTSSQPFDIIAYEVDNS